MATQSSILAWRIPWTGSLAGYSPWGHKESDTAERVTQPHNRVIRGLLVCLSTPGLGSMFPPQWVQVAYPVEELRSLVPHGVTRSLRGASCERVGQENSLKCPHSPSLQIARERRFPECEGARASCPLFLACSFFSLLGQGTI